MQSILSLIALLTLPAVASAQALYIDGATLNVTAGASLVVQGDFLNATGSTFSNSGTLKVTGNTTNNGSASAGTVGSLIFEGTSAQTLAGAAPVAAKNVTMNNVAGLTLATPLLVDGAMTFTTGHVYATSAAAPLVFTAGATVPAPPSDASHAVGFVRKEGTGAFTFPLGDGTKYQPVGVNLSANSAGLTARYIGSDAGAAPYGTTGADAMPLVAYNSLEHWDLAPVSAATGSVIIFFDGYKNVGVNNTTDLRVAHKRGSQWLNEGVVSVGGTASSGSVTSATVSTWSPFTLGSSATSSPLPLRWLDFSGTLTSTGQASLKWQVKETGIAEYEVEKSGDGRAFTSIAKLSSDGSNSYGYTESAPLSTEAFYRIRQHGSDGSTSYSNTIRLRPDADVSGRVFLYPNPAQGKAVLRVPSTLVGNAATFFSADGKMLQSVSLQSQETALDMSRWNPGVYTLRMADGTVVRAIKQ